MPDILIELEDAIIECLEEQARDRGIALNERLLQIICAEAVQERVRKAAVASGEG